MDYKPSVWGVLSIYWIRVSSHPGLKFHFVNNNGYPISSTFIYFDCFLNDGLSTPF